jgi:hypothetical protein
MTQRISIIYLSVARFGFRIIPCISHSKTEVKGMAIIGDIFFSWLISGRQEGNWKYAMLFDIYAWYYTILCIFLSSKQIHGQVHSQCSGEVK